MFIHKRSLLLCTLIKLFSIIVLNKCLLIYFFATRYFLEQTKKCAVIIKNFMKISVLLLSFRYWPSELKAQTLAVNCSAMAL